MKNALFFGSFNPIHIGHLALAQFALNFGGADAVTLVVSPQNPFKDEAELAPAQERLRMARLATEQDCRISVSDIEMRLPHPSYTINTLEALEAQNPGLDYAILMGEDNLAGLPRWHRAKELIAGRTFIVYPRPGYDADARIVEEVGGTVQRLAAPQMDISSSMLRQWIRQGKSIRHFVPPGVEDVATRLYLGEAGQKVRK